MSAPSLRGTVDTFDQRVGLGTVRGSDGIAHLFHCIAIADATRDIAVGAEVLFDLVAKLGKFEATAIRPV